MKAVLSSERSIVTMKSSRALPSAFPEGRLPRALEELTVRYGCESVILSTCNRVELYLARTVAPGRPRPAL